MAWLRVLEVGGEKIGEMLVLFCVIVLSEKE